MARVVKVPVAVQNPPLRFQAGMERGARVGREDVKRCGLDPLGDRPCDGSVEDAGVVLIHAEDEAAVDHHSQVVEAADRGAVVPSQVVVLVLLAEIGAVDGLKSHEQTAQSTGRGLVEQARLGARRENGVHRAGRLPEAPHAFHAVEQGARETTVPEQVVVKEVEVGPGQAVDFGECGVRCLGVEGLAAPEKGLLVAEVASVRTASCDHDRVGNQVEMPLDEVAPDGGEAAERPLPRLVAAGGAPATEVTQEPRPGILPGAEENGVGVLNGFLGKRRDMESAQRDEGSAAAVMIGDGVGASRAGGVDLDGDQVGRVIESDGLHVLVDQGYRVVWGKVAGQSGESERREQRVLDGAEEGAGRFGERGKEEFDIHLQAECHKPKDNVKYF